MSPSNTVNKFPGEVGSRGEEVKHLLPTGTREYKYNGNIKYMEKIIPLERCAFLALVGDKSTSTTCSPFVGFSQVGNNRDIAKLAFSYDRINQVLVLRMPSRPHELAISAFGGFVTEKLARMGLNFFHLSNLMSTTVKTSQREKDPDTSWQPTKLPQKISSQWPTFVLEVGFSESQAQLERDVRWWLEESNGDVGIAITIGIERKTDKLLVGRWEMEASSRPTKRNSYRGSVPQLTETVCIRPTSASNVWEADGTITLPSEKIFLRSPKPQESDLILTQKDDIDVDCPRIYGNRIVRSSRGWCDPVRHQGVMN
ncbi:hypothetical protein EMCG_02354 [[Emmonsia] crescens]|uniref:Uncharacterized protein n=1 Tax=[Emmonsia] crescens TaxID=73230 RepID=A0A0G2HZ03_9EURO|nr:hypothetical protein EMCG_02354 [Emmonsia crescens UAMH 3008]